MAVATPAPSSPTTRLTVWWSTITEGAEKLVRQVYGLVPSSKKERDGTENGPALLGAKTPISHAPWMLKP